MKSQTALDAKELRQQGKSIKEIARELGVSQSSVSRWCANIVLTTVQKEHLEKRAKEASMKALMPWVEKNKKKKIDDIELQAGIGIKDTGQVSKRDLFILGLGLYWGEGYKRGSQEFGFTNSDPGLILVFLKWLEQIYGITKDQLIARLTINERYKSEAERIQKEWVELTGILEAQFTAPSFITTTKTITNGEPRTYRGTLRIKVSKGTSLRRRILASIKEISDQISLNSLKTFS